MTTDEVDDLVHDLIEQVIFRGTQLALVRYGDLKPHARVALISRARRGLTSVESAGLSVSRAASTPDRQVRRR